MKLRIFDLGPEKRSAEFAVDDLLDGPEVLDEILRAAYGMAAFEPGVHLEAAWCHAERCGGIFVGPWPCEQVGTVKALP